MHLEVPPGHPFSPLAAILCGYEKSGTTLLNEILRRHPKLDSGFEVGALLAESPRQFRQIQPYFAFFRSTWKLTREDMQYICDTDEWGEFYRRSSERSPVIVDRKYQEIVGQGPEPPADPEAAESPGPRAGRSRRPGG